jgi:succinate dehydrogenase / fumarate reductase cytochrome b subunit
MSDYYHAPLIPKAFIWKRAHSLTGLWLVLFLISHLLTNSQAALLVGENGKGFVNAVNFIQGLPYLPIVEMLLIGIPFLIHGIWGILYLFTAKYNSFQTDGSSPSLPQYPLNQAYTWQRITSWILLVGIVAHVIHMRYIDYPTKASIGTEQSFMVRLDFDEGLYTLSERLGFEIYTPKDIEETKKHLLSLRTPAFATPASSDGLKFLQHKNEETNWLAALEERPLKKDQVIAVSKNFGLAELLMLRDTFKSPLMIILYSGLVLAACFHAFNGLWTFMISWGVTLTKASQDLMRKLAVSLMVLISFLGLAAIWGSYWINLYN